ncbi:MAG: ABC transporter substrate binding protein [Candidatus Sulfotelmatobacter sp.]
MGFFAVIQAAASSTGIDASSITVDDPGEIEKGIGAFAQSSNPGLIVLPNAVTIAHRKLIIALVAKRRMPAIYPFRVFATGGGMISYGTDLIDQCRRAASYVDRILKGEKPADLSVQQPTKFELIINLKTAHALGINVPDELLARADEVIE